MKPPDHLERGLVGELQAGATGASAASIEWGVEALWNVLAPLLPGLTIEVMARCDSTNSQLLRRARAQVGIGSGGDGGSGAAGVVVRPGIENRAFGRRAVDLMPCLLIAEHQFAGRGRQGRQWESAAGASLTFSLVLPLPVADWSGLSLAVGVAICEAIDAIDPGHRHGLRCVLKWPNDLWLQPTGEGSAEAPGDASCAAIGRKLGGILVETVAAGSQRLVIVGVGLNVSPLDGAAAAGGRHAAGSPGSGSGSTSTADAFSSGFASVSEIDPGADVSALLARVAPALVVALQQFQRDGFGGFGSRFDAFDLLRGLPVTTTHERARLGIARGVTTQGALRIETATGTVDVTSGAVSIRIGPESAPDPDPEPGTV